MAAKSVGTCIKEARTGAGMTQEQLARKIAGLSASDISKAERGEINLTQAQLKAIAKATGVTQASLLNAAKSSSGKKPASTAKKPSSGTSMKLTATEKKLVELYRSADKTTKDMAMKVLKGEGSASVLVESALGGVVSAITGKK